MARPGVGHNRHMSFPRQYARTQRFTLGVPRSFTVSRDGHRILFVQSRDGTDPVACLWQVTNDDPEPRLVADPRRIGGDDDALPEEERARRERARETGAGVVGYTTDAATRDVVFALAGRLYHAPLGNGVGAVPRELPAAAPAVDPLLSPDGRSVAYVHQGAVHVLDLVSGTDRVVAAPDGEAVTWGLAEFVAAEEMGRFRGMWWAPDSAALLAARVDEAPVERWYLADPAAPADEPRGVRYPVAGTANAEVSLAMLPIAGEGDGVGAPAPVEWDAAAFPYLVTASWPGTRPTGAGTGSGGDDGSGATGPGNDSGSPGPVIVVQSRDQRELRVLSVDPRTGRTAPLRVETAGDWVEIGSGVPSVLPGGALVWIAPREDRPALVVDDDPVTPPELYVRAVVDIDGDTVLFSASTEPTEIDLWTYRPGDGVRRLTDPGGLSSGWLGGGTLVVQRRSLEETRVTTTVAWPDAEPLELASLAEAPELPEPRVALCRVGERDLRAAVLYPSWHTPGSGRLPVLMDPYGGPHAQRVLAARQAYLTPQWFAEQGFAVVVADGRGSPGRGRAWETAIRGDLAGPPLEDQVAALHGVAATHPDLDLGRVAIRGWSFGGYLAALAVLRRPDVFHAAVAGAPVTDWMLYDTHYTERYLGLPGEEPESYQRSSLLGDAEKLSRPLLLIHGLVDDNVVFAHTQRLSAALLAAGRPHTVLPLSGVTHLASDETTAENLLLLQVEFLRDALNQGPGG